MHILVPPPWVGPRWMEIRFMGNFTGPIKSNFQIFHIGVPIHKKKSRDETTIITETGKTPERNDTICGSPFLFSFIVTEGENSKNGYFDAFVRD